MRDLEQECPDSIPAGLARLAQHGVPVGRFPSCTHQEEALLASFGNAPNLGELDLKSTLVYFLGYLIKAVMTPIKDLTGQTSHVDG